MSHDGSMVAEIERLKSANQALTEQLVFARQKASLYYIATSELDTLKRAIVYAEKVDKETITDLPATRDVSVSTEVNSEVIELKWEMEQLRSEICVLKSINSLNEKTERNRINFSNNLIEINSPIFDHYSQLFQTYLHSTHQSINHSVEMRKRDIMIGSLLDKIRVLETSFNQKLAQSEIVAQSRQEVINELGEQVKMAVNTIHNPPDWESLAAMHSEMEDLRAELSMARSNWAATRDELVRLQFRTGDVAKDERKEYPSPLIALLDKQGQPGLVAAIRKVKETIEK